MQHTLNRTTNLVMDNLPAEMLHHFPHGTPAAYLSLLYRLPGGVIVCVQKDIETDQSQGEKKGK